MNPDERFLSPGAAFAAQQAEETRLLLAIEKSLAALATRAKGSASSYSLSQPALRRQWEEDVTRAVESLGLSGPAGEQLKATLVDFDAGGQLFEVVDSVMKFGLSVGATRLEINQALNELLEVPGLTAAGAIKDLWNRVKDWVQPKRRHWRTKARAMTRTAYTGYSGHLAQAWLAANGHQTKMWVTRHDDKVRDTHRAADGQVVPVNAPFQVGAATLMYPGQHGGPIEEVINCRCVTISGDRR